MANNIYDELCWAIENYIREYGISPNTLYIGKSKYEQLYKFVDKYGVGNSLWYHNDIIEICQCVVKHSLIADDLKVNYNPFVEATKQVQNDVENYDDDRKLRNIKPKMRSFEKNKLIDKLLFTKYEEMKIVNSLTEEEKIDMDNSLEELHSWVMFYKYLEERGDDTTF